MELNTELLEITKDNLAEAQFMASNFIDKSVQNRIFFNVAGSEALISYLEKFNIDVSHIASIHSIKRVIEKIDIADVILDNIHIDVRVVFNDNEIFIPKSHFTLGIVPDIYAVLKYDKSFQRINFIGFFEASAINLNYHNDDYYFIDSDKLQSPFEMLDFIKNFKGSTEKKLSEAQFLKGRELSIAVADHDVTNDEFNEFLSLLIKSSDLRGSVLEYDNFETLASNVAFALQVSKSKRREQIETINMDDFMNMRDDTLENEESDNTESKSSNPVDEDVNGDSLLDEVTDISTGIAEAAAGTAAIAGAAEAAAGLSAGAVSKEAIDLAAVAGDVVSDAADIVSENITETSAQTDIDSAEDLQIDDIEQETAESDDVHLSDTESEDLSLEGDEIPNIFDEDLSDFPDLNLSENEFDSQELEPCQTPESENSDIPENLDSVNEEEGADETEITTVEEETADVESEISSDTRVTDIEENQEIDIQDLDMQSDEFGDDTDMDAFDDFIKEEPSEAQDDNEVSETVSELQDADIGDIALETDNNPESEQDIGPFDAGDSLDIKDEDFSNMFEDETSNDLDFGDGTELSAEEVSQEDENLNEADEDGLTADTENEIDNTADEETEEEQGADLSNVVSEDLITENAVEDERLSEDDLTSDSFDELSIGDDLSEDSPQELEFDDNLEEVSDIDISAEDSLNDKQEEETFTVNNDEQSEDKEPQDDTLVVDDVGLDSVDDELIIHDEGETKVSLEDADINDVLEGNLETFVAPNEEFVRSVTSELAENEDKFDNPSMFEELPSETVAEVENKKSADDYGLVNFSDLADSQIPSPENEEINFADIDDFTSFESISPFGEQNSEVDFTSGDSEIAITDTNIVKENSFVISDKNHNPGEIFIDINKDPSKVDISLENEHLEELYNKNNALSDDSGLNNDVRVVGEKEKSIPLALGVGGIALVVLLAGIIIFSVSKFMNPQQDEGDSLVMNNNTQSNDNNIGTDVPNVNPDSDHVVMNDNISQGSVPRQNANQPNTPSVGTVQKQTDIQPSKPIPATSFLSVKKLSWEVPDYVSTDASFRQYFQSAGKSLKASLSSDLLLATDYTYSDQIRLSILFSNDGTFKQARVLLSSGSSQVDNIVLQSVNQTLKVLKAPNSLGNDQSTTVILKIYL